MSVRNAAFSALAVVLFLPAFNPAESGSTTTAAAAASSRNATMDSRTERRLRDRWNEFMSERTKAVRFDDETTSSGEVHVIQGKDLYVSCGLNRPLTGKLKISFMRIKDLNLLSVGKKLHIPDPRVEVINSRDSPRVWTLRVRDAAAADTGQYECQVNSRPDTVRRMFNVTVLRGEIRLEEARGDEGGGGEDGVVYLNVGSTLSLTCVVDTGPLLRPQFIMWSRDDHIVEYSSEISARVWTNLSSSSSSPTHRSRMVIEDVRQSDSGRYRCDTDLTGAASVQVYVVREDSESLHHGKDSAVMASSVGESERTSVFVLLSCSVAFLSR